MGSLENCVFIYSNGKSIALNNCKLNKVQVNGLGPCPLQCEIDSQPTGNDSIGHNLAMGRKTFALSNLYDPETRKVYDAFVSGDQVELISKFTVDKYGNANLTKQDRLTAKVGTNWYNK
jgi:hypothetical protein